MVNRRDHFERMRHEEQAPVEIDKDVPKVSLELVDYLEKRLDTKALNLSVPRTVDDAVSTLGLLAEVTGAKDVVGHLRQIAEAQLKKPSR